MAAKFFFVFPGIALSSAKHPKLTSIELNFIFAGKVT